MKKLLFLFIIINLVFITQAFAINTSDENINGFNREMLTSPESAVGKNIVETRKSASISKAKIHPSQSTSGMSVKHNKASLNGSQSLDLSEPSVVILLGVGTVIGMLAKWRKSFKEF